MTRFWSAVPFSDLKRAGRRAGVLGVTVSVIAFGMSWVAGPAAADPPQPTPQTVSYTVPGTYTYTVLPNITSITVAAAGASGGNYRGGDPSQGGSFGGNGGQTTATIAVTPGQQLQINVGGTGGPATTYHGNACDQTSGGFNGGGAAGYGATTGGGASDVRTGAFGLADRLVVGGGGGGGGVDVSPGGAGGNPAGSGVDPFHGQFGTSTNGGAGTQTAGGAGGGGYANGATGTAGAGGIGGCTTATTTFAGSGGGGGYFGGGGGAAYYGYSGGAGGGSSFGPAGSTFANGSQSGNGAVSLTFTAPSVGAATTLQMTPSTATVSAGQTESYVVHAFDVYGDDLGDVTASTSFTIAGGSCTANACSALSAGNHIATASYSGLTATATLTVLATSALVLSGLPSATSPGTSMNLTINAHDSSGNPALGDNSTLTFTSTDGNAILPAPTTLTSGSVTVPITLDNAGNQTVTVTEAGSGVKATSAAVAVSGAVSFTVAGFPSSVTAGQSGTVTVTALDANGSVVPDYAGQVALSSSDPNAVVPAPATLTNGTGSFAVTLTRVGTQSIVATGVRDASLTGSQTGIQVGPNTLAKLVGTGVPGSVVAGTAFNFTVSGTDQYGNPVSSYAGTVHLTSTDPAATLAGDSTTAGGTASESATLRTAGTQTITFTDSGAGITGSVNVTVSAATTSGVRGTLAGPTTAGTSRTLTITTVDQYGNPAPMNGYAFVTTSDSRATVGNAGCCGVNAMIFNGSGQTSVTLATAGSISIQISFCDVTAFIMSGETTNCRFYNGINGGHVYNYPFSATVTAGAPAAITISGLGSTTQAGSAKTVTVTAVDAYGNRTTAVDALTLTSTDPQAILPTDATLTNGVFTGPVTLETAGSRTITATTPANVSGTSAAVVVTPAAPAAIALVGYPDGAVVGDHIHNLTATVTDQYANPTPSYAGTLTVISSDPKAVLPGPITVTNGTAQIPVELRTAGPQTISVSDLSSPTLTGSLAVTLAPAAVSALVLTPAGGSIIAGQPTDLTVTARDEFGNVVTDDNATIAVTASDPTGSQPATVTLASGAATFTVIAFTAGTDTITVTGGAVSGSSTITVVAGPAATLALAGLPTGVEPGAPVSITITALDTQGNVAVGDNGSVTLTTTDPRANLPVGITLTNGVAHVAISLRTVGAQTVTATAPGLPSSTLSTLVRKVASVPGSPVAVAAPGQVTLSWAAPVSDGGATISGYEVFVGTRSGHEAVTPVNPEPIPGTTYTVTGLKNGVTYYFVVRAVNAAGVSPKSAEASATPASAPLAPTAVTVDRTLGPGLLGLSWTPPRSTGGSAILGYNVYVGTTTGGESSTPVNASLITGTSFTVSGLTSGKRYFFQVRAVNAVGASAASRQIAGTAP